MKKAEEGLVKCRMCNWTRPRIIYDDKGAVKKGPEDAMSALMWHFQTEHSLEFSRHMKHVDQAMGRP